MTSDITSPSSRIDALAASHPHVPAFLARASGSVPASAEGRRIEMIIDALEHDEQIAGEELRPAWDAVIGGLEAGASHPTDNEGPAFLADALRFKALTMIALNQVRDYTDMSALIATATPAGAAGALAGLDAEGLPLATTLVRRLGAVRPRKRVSGSGAVTEDPTAEQWARTTGDCIALATLIVTGAPTGPARKEWTTESIVTAIDEGGLDSWRSILAAIGDDPWCPVAQHLNEALLVARDKGVTAALREALHTIRHNVELDEHRDVAHRVTEYIASAGITQRAFAARIGTSPSRLSTYANGSVTPSAAMMLRIAKVSARISVTRP